MSMSSCTSLSVAPDTGNVGGGAAAGDTRTFVGCACRAESSRICAASAPCFARTRCTIVCTTFWILLALVSVLLSVALSICVLVHEATGSDPALTSSDVYYVLPIGIITSVVLAWGAFIWARAGADKK